MADAVTFILLVLIIEPFFIGLAGATPGKWLMGIRVTRSDGRNLGYGGAFARTFMVITLGLALYIPVASFVAMLLQFLRVSNGNRAAWDDILDSTVVHVQRPVLLWLVLIALIVGVRVALRWEEIQARFSQ